MMEPVALPMMQMPLLPSPEGPRRRCPNHYRRLLSLWWGPGPGVATAEMEDLARAAFMDVVEAAARSYEAKKVRNSIYFIVRVIWWLKWGGWVTLLLFIHLYSTQIYCP